MELKTVNFQTPERPVHERNPAYLDVIEIWYTIQGEGPLAGTPAVFVRLAGCNLKCPLCFGVSTKSRIPYLSRSVGPKLRLDKARVGDKVLTFNTDMELVETEVKSVISHKVTEWLELRIAGKTYDVTPEHPFFTNRGVVAAEDLEVGDQILEARPREIIAFKKKGGRNPMKDPEVAARSASNTDYVAAGRKTSDAIRAKQAAGTYSHSTLSMTDEEKEDMRRKQSESKRGDLNPNWKGEHPNLNREQASIASGEWCACVKCHAVDVRLLVHHLDGDHNNDEAGNLAVWCHKCHNQHHERGYNFWNGSRKDGKELVEAHNGQEVQKVTRCSGKLEVCNVSCGPENTFLANGMLVHNCDTDYTTGRQTASVADVLAAVDLATPEQYASPDLRPLVVLTGGEPFRQPIGLLTRELIAEGYRVQVETNGSVFLEDFPYLGNVLIVCSPKTPVVVEGLKRYVDALKYVLHADSVSPQDGLPLRILAAPCAVARPWVDFRGEVYVQPLDEGDAEANARHTAAAVKSSMQYGYRFALQVHKVLGLA